jgi:site-specific DNA recombinase
MQRGGGKNPAYRCATKRLNTGFDCSDDKIPEADILEAVVDTIQVYAQYAVSIERLQQTRQAQRQLDRKQAQRRLQTLQSRKAQLDERLQDLYEHLVEGEISRESFAAQKKSMTAQAEEISHTILELERKISGSDDNGNAVIEQFKSYTGITALTKEISAELLQSVTIYPDGRMDIRLNLADEIKALMETLRRESCTA